MIQLVKEKGLLFGYARVSTLEQNLDRQIEALIEAGCKEENIFKDKFTGATLERPQLIAMMEKVEAGDTIIITDLTRFSRSTMDLFNLVDQVKEKGVFLKSIKDTWLDISKVNPYSDFLLTIMSAVSQLERDLTRERQREGIKIAKAKGKYKGRPATFTENNPRLKHALDLYSSGSYTVKEVCKVTGVSEATFYRNWKLRKENTQ